MVIANFITKTKDFLIRRITELFAILIIFSAISILFSLITYSPDDPNFIKNNYSEIENIMGFRGSIISDFLFQSVGLISFCIPFTLFFSGIHIFINKRQILLIDNLFFCILYIICGTLFFLL